MHLNNLWMNRGRRPCSFWELVRHPMNPTLPYTQIYAVTSQMFMELVETRSAWLHLTSTMKQLVLMVKCHKFPQQKSAVVVWIYRPLFISIVFRRQMREICAFAIFTFLWSLIDKVHVQLEVIYRYNWMINAMIILTIIYISIRAYMYEYMLKMISFQLSI